MTPKAHLALDTDANVCVFELAIHSPPRQTRSALHGACVRACPGLSWELRTVSTCCRLNWFTVSKINVIPGINFKFLSIEQGQDCGAVWCTGRRGCFSLDIVCSRFFWRNLHSQWQEIPRRTAQPQTGLCVEACRKHARVVPVGMLIIVLHAKVLMDKRMDAATEDRKTGWRLIPTFLAYGIWHFLNTSSWLVFGKVRKILEWSV